jgi:glyoxylase-like metal-dependent hydrolase (beta-lactamase superfamily II)
MNQARKPRRLASGVFMVGGPDLTDPRDCLCYLVNGQQARVLIDCGAGPSAHAILELAVAAVDKAPTHLLLTHAHIDHAGGAAEIKRRTGCKVIIHAGDAQVLAGGDVKRSAADWYGLALEPLEADEVLRGDGAIALSDQEKLHIVHTPGHTPGSLAAWCLADGLKVLFGQDVHGPFAPAFGSNLDQWRDSMQRLLDLEADVLAEGHFGVFRPADEVRAFIEEQLETHRD